MIAFSNAKVNCIFYTGDGYVQECWTWTDSAGKDNSGTNYVLQLPVYVVHTMYDRQSLCIVSYLAPRGKIWSGGQSRVSWAYFQIVERAKDQ